MKKKVWVKARYINMQLKSGEISTLLMFSSFRQGPQTEVSHRVLENGGIEKRAQVSVLCNVSYFDEPHAELRPVAISGVAVSLRAKGARAVASLKKSKF